MGSQSHFSVAAWRSARLPSGLWGSRRGQIRDAPFLRTSFVPKLQGPRYSNVGGVIAIWHVNESARSLQVTLSTLIEPSSGPHVTAVVASNRAIAESPIVILRGVSVAGASSFTNRALRLGHGIASLSPYL